jgi:hypothetical protein
MRVHPFIGDIRKSLGAESLSGGSAAAALRRTVNAATPSETAAALGLQIEFGEWHPVTAGEYDKRNGKITVNRKAPVDFEAVIAHEIGHYILEGLEMKSDERFCDEFAEALTGDGSDPNHADGLER